MAATTLSVIPAYGRDYLSAKDVAKDVLAGKDFIVSDVVSGWDGKYVNLTDAMKAGITTFSVKYNHSRYKILVSLTNE